jgi:hypothetical protein
MAYYKTKKKPDKILYVPKVESPKSTLNESFLYPVSKINVIFNILSLETDEVVLYISKTFTKF